MPEFIVRRFNEFGVPELELVKVDAENAHAAAEKACGSKLTDSERPQLYLR